MTDLGIAGITNATPFTAGGSSVIYEATQSDFDRRVAVKILRGPADKELQRRFDRERRAVGRLSGHPGIVDIYAGGVTDAGELYLVMPFIEGGSLQAELDRNGAFPVERALQDVIIAAQAVDFAHRHGIVHRDIKPGNLLRGATGQPVVTDFGIARIRDSGVASSTIAATTPLYAAPEVLSDGEASEATDIYSLGALLYALLAGRPPFSDKSTDNIWKLIERIRTEEPKPIAGVPARVMEVIEQAMAKDPKKRPASAALLAQYLKFAADEQDRRPQQMVRDVPARRTPPRGTPVVPAEANQKSVAMPSAVAAPMVSPGPPPTTSGATARVNGAPSHGASPSDAYGVDGYGGATKTSSNGSNGRYGADSWSSNLNGSGPGAGSSNGSPPPDYYPDHESGSPFGSKLALLGAGVGLIVLLAVGIGLFTLLTGGSGSDSVASGTEAPQRTVPTPRIVASTPIVAPTSTPIVATVAPTPPATATPVPANYENPRFDANIPEGWTTTSEHVDVGYGFRTRFTGPDTDFMFVDTTPADRVRGDITIEESAYNQARSIRSASPVAFEVIGDKQAWSFTFTGNDGSQRIDIFFELDGNGYAVVAGSRVDPEGAFDTAREFVASLETADA